MARASLSVRVSDSVPARLDVLAPRIAPPGAEFGRSDAARAALERGLAVLEEELGLAEVEEKPAAPKAKKPSSAKSRAARR
jgi:predicted transcriptional regulator